MDLQSVDLVAACSGLVASYITFRLARLYTSIPPPTVPLVPHPKGLLGFLGRAWIPILKEEFGAPHTRYAKEIAAKYKPGMAFTYELGPNNWRVALAHPDDVEHILLKNGKNYGKDGSYRPLHQILGTSGLVVLRDESKHTQQRRMVAPAFNPLTLKNIANTVLTRQISKYLLELEQQFAADPTAAVSLDHTFDHIALDTVAEAAFKQVDFEGANVKDEFRTVMKNTGLSWFAVLSSIMPFLRGKGLVKKERIVKRSVGRLRNAGAALASTARKALEETAVDAADIKANCLIDHLVLEKDLASNALLDHIVTFLFAGHETTSKGLLWTAYRLARHPDVQEELFEELVSVATLDSIPSIDSVKDLPFLNQVLKESLRLHPPIGMVLREALEDDVLPYSKVFIPKGQGFALNVQLIHHSKLVYGEDADDFVPERWAKEKGLEDRIGSCGWMPFLVGKRNCIGKDFAWNELLLVIAVLVRRFKLSLPPGTPTPKKTMKASIRPKDDLPFILEARV